MKWLLTTVFFITALTVAHTAFAAPGDKSTCKFETGDVGTVIGRGDSHNQAYGDAIEKCYMKREALFEKARAHVVDIERGQDLLDSCSTLTCS